MCVAKSRYTHLTAIISSLWAYMPPTLATIVSKVIVHVDNIPPVYMVDNSQFSYILVLVISYLRNSMVSAKTQSILSLMYSEALLNPADLWDIEFILNAQPATGLNYSFGQLWSMGKDRVSQVRRELTSSLNVL